MCVSNSDESVKNDAVRFYLKSIVYQILQNLSYFFVIVSQY